MKLTPEEKIENFMKEHREKLFSISSQEMKHHHDNIGQLMFYQSFRDFKNTEIQDHDIIKVEEMILAIVPTKMDDVINIARLQIRRAAMKMIQDMQQS